MIKCSVKGKEYIISVMWYSIFWAKYLVQNRSSTQVENFILKRSAKMKIMRFLLSFIIHYFFDIEKKLLRNRMCLLTSGDTYIQISVGKTQGKHYFSDLLTFPSTCPISQDHFQYLVSLSGTTKYDFPCLIIV